MDELAVLSLEPAEGRASKDLRLCFKSLTLVPINANRARDVDFALLLLTQFGLFKLP
jgi:hypothetical protein